MKWAGEAIRIAVPLRHHSTFYVLAVCNVLDVLGILASTKALKLFIQSQQRRLDNSENKTDVESSQLESRLLVHLGGGVLQPPTNSFMIGRHT